MKNWPNIIFVVYGIIAGVCWAGVTVAKNSGTPAPVSLGKDGKSKLGFTILPAPPPTPPAD